MSHRGEVKKAERNASEDTSGTDTALAALQSSLASYEQEKQSKQVNITNSVLPVPKNRFDAARKEKLAKKSAFSGKNSGSRPASPSPGGSSTPQLGMAPTSAPASEDEVKMQAMKTPVIHLLALGPTRSEEIVKKTHIPKEDLENILQKVGKQSEGKWQLNDRAYKELDVWKFDYPSQEKRQAAIDNAVRSYDRMRLGKDDKLWQMLLPKEDRGKGKVLSRLHLGGGPVNRGLTPQYQPSPIPHLDGQSDSRAASAANTPKLDPSGTPRPGSSKGDVMKRLLSKDPKKARAAEDAKDKKRKEREAAASDREGGKPVKKQAARKTNPAVKSAEFVHSSDEESGEDGEVDVRNKPQPKSTQEKPKATIKAKPNAKSSTSPESSDTAAERSKAANKSTPKATPGTKASASPAVKASRPATTGKSTPQAINSLAAPSSKHKSQHSPQKSDSRPSVPSPLGAARPRVASDVSDRAAVGVQRVKQSGTETPKGLGITNGVRKRQDTVTNAESIASSKPAKKSENQTSSEKQQKPATNGIGTPKKPLTNGIAHKPEGGVKRKAEDSPSQQREGTPIAKHRKTDSSSSQSQKSHGSSNMATNGTNHTSPDGPFDGGSSSDSAGSVLDTITYNQGVALAEKFQSDYYPAYTKLYDEQVAKEARGETVSKEERQRLLLMHKRLEQMKREIVTASKRVE